MAAKPVFWTFFGTMNALTGILGVRERLEVDVADAAVDFLGQPKNS